MCPRLNVRLPGVRGCLLSTQKPKKKQTSQGAKQPASSQGTKKGDLQADYLSPKQSPVTTDLTHKSPGKSTDLAPIAAEQSPLRRGKKAKRFTKGHCKLALQMSSNGSYNKDIAKAFGISQETFYKWIRKYPEFETSIKQGVDSRTLDVEKQMVLGALGEEKVTEITSERVIKRETNPDTGIVTEQVLEVRQVEKVRDVPADYNKQRFILLNKAPDRYRKEQDADGQMITIIQAPEIKKRKPGREQAAAQAEGGNGNDSPSDRKQDERL